LALPELPRKRSGEIYESIHKAVQYKNTGGAMQIASNMNESDGITMNLKGTLPMFIQCRKK
jgi:hypothetical protein